MAQQRRKLLKLSGVLDRTALSKAALYRKVADGEFPEPIKLGVRASAWIEEEVDGWIEGRIAQSRGGIGGKHVSKSQEIRERNLRVSELTLGGKSMTEISKILGITRNQVAYARKKLGITEPRESWQARVKRRHSVSSLVREDLFERI